MKKRNTCEDQRYVPEEEAKFLAALRQPGASKPLQEMAEGLFQKKDYPLDYAYGLTIGAGLIRCECGLWGDIDDLTNDDNIPMCPHEPMTSRQRYVQADKLQKAAALLKIAIAETKTATPDEISQTVDVVLEIIINVNDFLKSR